MTLEMNQLQGRGHSTNESIGGYTTVVWRHVQRWLGDKMAVGSVVDYGEKWATMQYTRFREFFFFSSYNLISGKSSQMFHRDKERYLKW
jgi:hypothetical protein